MNRGRGRRTGMRGWRESYESWIDVLSVERQDKLAKGRGPF